MNTVQYEDRAYAAGFFDGEGCVTAQRTGRPVGTSTLFYVTVSITQKNPAVLEWFKTRYGGSISRNRRHIHRLRITGREAVERFLLDVSPYCKVKKTQVVVALEIIRSRDPEDHDHKAQLLKDLKRV